MGFRDFIDNMKDGGFKRMINDGRELFTESSQEMTELMTDGFKEMVIKGNSNYKTSFEKKNEADVIIGRAKSRLNDKVKQLQKSNSEIDELLSRQLNMKQKVLKEFLIEFKGKIDSVKRTRHIAEESNCTFNISNINAKISNLNVNGCRNIIGIIDNTIGIRTAIAQSNRIQVANEYLEDAKLYKERVNLKIEELDSLQVKLEAIKYTICDEQKVLERIFRNINQIQSRIDLYNKKIILNKEQRVELINLVEIAKFLYNSSYDNFISKDGKVSEEYLIYLQNIKNAINKANLQ